METKPLEDEIQQPEVRQPVITYSTPRTWDIERFVELSVYHDGVYVWATGAVNGDTGTQDLFDRAIAGEFGEINIAPGRNYRWNIELGEWEELPPPPLQPDQFLTNLNTIVDTNGNVKTASPVIKLGVVKNEETGEIEAIVTPLTREAMDANITAERIFKGRYVIKGVLGTHEDEQWSIAIPTDLNGNNLVHVDYYVAYQGQDINNDGSYFAEMGDIILDTYHKVQNYDELKVPKDLNINNNLWELEDGSYKRIRELPAGIIGRLVEEWEDVDIPSGKGQALDIRVNIYKPD